LHDLKINVALFAETHLKPHIRFYIPNYDIYRTDREDGHKAGTANAVKKGIPHTCVNLPPPLSVEAREICLPTGNTETLLAVLYVSPQRLWCDTDITKLLGFRNKSILAGDLNVKHPVWNSKFSNHSGFKFLELFVSSNFEISASQCSTQYTSGGKGYVLYIVVHQSA
jgi:hypothetical protein